MPRECTTLRHYQRHHLIIIALFIVINTKPSINSTSIGWFTNVCFIFFFFLKHITNTTMNHLGPFNIPPYSSIITSPLTYITYDDTCLLHHNQHTTHLLQSINQQSLKMMTFTTICSHLFILFVHSFILSAPINDLETLIHNMSFMMLPDACSQRTLFLQRHTLTINDTYAKCHSLSSITDQ